jgi:hypothetical protein
MLVMRLLWLRLRRQWYEWALREIDPMDDGVPELVEKMQAIAEEERQLLAHAIP